MELTSLTMTRAGPPIIQGLAGTHAAQLGLHVRAAVVEDHPLCADVKALVDVSADAGGRRRGDVDQRHPIGRHQHLRAVDARCSRVRTDLRRCAGCCQQQNQCRRNDGRGRSSGLAGARGSFLNRDSHLTRRVEHNAVEVLVHSCSLPVQCQQPCCSSPCSPSGAKPSGIDRSLLTQKEGRIVRNNARSAAALVHEQSERMRITIDAGPFLVCHCRARAARKSPA